MSAIIVAGVLGILTFPGLFGLERAAVFAQIVSFRGVLVIAGLVLLVVTIVALAASRRKFAPLVFLLVFALFTGSNAAVLLGRGLGATPAVAESGSDSGSITVLSWNTLGGAADPDTIAALALANGADVVALAETTDETATRVAEIMGEAGAPMWSHTTAWSESLDARSTSVLISTALGDYRLSDRFGTTGVLPSIVAEPVDGDGPLLASVHPVSPTFGEMADWRADLDWITDLCAADDLIAAGDFNATLDHLDLGACTDSARAAGVGGLGTWPTRIPALLAAPIDHVIATSQWETVSAQVVQSEDAAGSDHRPIVATLQRR